MSANIFKFGTGVILGLLLAGCATPSKLDYSSFREHHPRSILVLPPLNESTDIGGSYGYLSTVTMPLAEMGYYVYPVAVVDQFLKENGMPTPGEMHQVPLDKVRQIIGADAVLYITLTQYGTKYQVLNSATIVSAKAKLVDTATGVTIWEGTGVAQESSGGSGSLIGDLVAAAMTQAINKGTDHAHDLSRMANYNMLVPVGRGLLYGPRHPEFGKEKP